MALVYPSLGLTTSVERNHLFLVRGLVALGIDVHCYCLRDSSVDALDVTYHHIDAISPSPTRYRSRLNYPLARGSFAVRATRALRRDRGRYDVVDVRETSAWEHDVVTVHGVPAATLARWPRQEGRDYRAARLRAAAAPVIRPQIALDRLVQRLQFRRGRFRRAIAESNQVRDDLVSVHGVPPSLIDLVPPPMDLDRFIEPAVDAPAGRAGVRASLGLSNKEHVVLFVGHAFARKGLSEAIQAIAAVPDAHLVVVGNGDRKPFVDAAERAGAGGRVHFAGATPDPHRFYHEADLLLLPTRADNWGNPLIEAMAAGIPVVSTAAAGAADPVREAGAGIILPNGSMPALARAVSSLLHDPDERRKMGDRGRKMAHRFSVVAHARAVLETYRQALES